MKTLIAMIVLAISMVFAVANVVIANAAPSISARNGPRAPGPSGGNFVPAIDPVTWGTCSWCFCCTTATDGNAGGDPLGEVGPKRCVKDIPGCTGVDPNGGAINGLQDWISVAAWLGWSADFRDEFIQSALNSCTIGQGQYGAFLTAVTTCADNPPFMSSDQNPDFTGQNNHVPDPDDVCGSNWTMRCIQNQRCPQ